MTTRLLFAASALVLAGIAEAQPGGEADDLKAAVHKLSEAANYSWSVSTSSSGETSERYASGPLEGKTEKGGLTWIRTRETPPVEVVLKGTKMAVRIDEGWALEQDLASGGKARGHANLSLVRSVKGHPRPAAQSASLLKYAKELKEEQPGYFTSPLSDDSVKELLRQTLKTSRRPEIASQGGWLSFWVKDGILTRYEITLQGTVNYPAPAASSWSADLRTTVELSGFGTTSMDVPEDARKKVE